MPTHIEIARERELLSQLGLRLAPLWLPRCTSYRKDGSVADNLLYDPCSRFLYMSRGLRPDVVGNSIHRPQNQACFVAGGRGLLHGRKGCLGRNSR
ncbi:MAG: hypothetical protein QGI09_05460 [Dehalococcoidia bacterium]|nr:hypothetical protein [Dehalococcoidia bacterium]